MPRDDDLTDLDISEALVGDVAPAQLDGYRFAQSILPAFGLIKALFSQNRLDTCLKLMVLHELSRAGGRRTIEQLRALARFLDPDRVDGLVRSLAAGGWLELRAVDHTYTLSVVGLQLLGLLHAADLGSVTPGNALARAAQNARFGAELDGAGSSVGYLLDQLQVLVEKEVDEARVVLRSARPHRLIAWSRAQHARQLETIRGVLGSLEERLEHSTRELTRVVRLHRVMQDLIGMHASIQDRLREWNLERLHTSEAGYSVAQLVEAVLGSEDELVACVREGLVQLPLRAPALSTDELRTRFHGARRRAAGVPDDWSYEAPVEAPLGAWSPAAADPAAALRAHLAAVLVDATPLEPGEWLPQQDTAFAPACWRLSVLSQLEARGPVFGLDRARQARVHQPATPRPNGVSAEALVDALTEAGAVTELPLGHVASVRIGLEGHHDG